MTGLQRTALAVILAATAFATAFTVTRATQQTRGTNAARETQRGAATLTDSQQLDVLGIHPGRQLVVYVFGGPGCGYCRRPETKETFRTLKQQLSARHRGQFANIALVGVGVDRSIEKGTQYLSEIGLDHFDEISVGDGWQNEHITQLIRYRRTAEPGMPLIIVLSRPLTARLRPLQVHVGPDTAVVVAQGRNGIANWVKAGYPLRWLPTAATDTTRVRPGTAPLGTLSRRATEVGERPASGLEVITARP